MCCYMFKTKLFLPLFHIYCNCKNFVFYYWRFLVFVFLLVTQLFHYGADQFKVLTAAG